MRPYLSSSCPVPLRHKASSLEMAMQSSLPSASLFWNAVRVKIALEQGNFPSLSPFLAPSSREHQKVLPHIHLDFLVLQVKPVFILKKEMISFFLQKTPHEAWSTFLGSPTLETFSLTHLWEARRPQSDIPFASLRPAFSTLASILYQQKISLALPRTDIQK